MSLRWVLRVFCVVSLACASPAAADETCQSPYLPKVTGQEDYLYVWTLGVDGLGDGSDKLVTVGVKPTRAETGYGWIRPGTAIPGSRGRASWVQTFIEKPTRGRASASARTPSASTISMPISPTPRKASPAAPRRK